MTLDDSGSQRIDKFKVLVAGEVRVKRGIQNDKFSGGTASRTEAHSEVCSQKGHQKRALSEIDSVQPGGDPV